MKDEDRNLGVAKDIELITAAREKYIEARLYYQEHRLENGIKAASYLQNAIMTYHEVLRPLLKQRAEYWEKARYGLMSNSGEELLGLQQLDRLEAEYREEEIEKETLTEGTKRIKERRPVLLPLNVLREAGRLLDEAYKDLGLGVEAKLEQEIPIGQYSDIEEG